MPRLTTLTNEVLKHLLRGYELDTAGVKAQLVQRLTTHLGTDEIEEATLALMVPQPITGLQAQIDQLTESIRILMADRQANRNETAQNNVTNGTHENVQQNAVNGQNDAANVQQSASNEPNNAVNEPRLYRHASIQSVASIASRSEVTRVTHSVRDVAAVLPEFDPSKDQLTALQFVNKVENLMVAYGWHENVVLYAIQGKLRGHAKTWIDAQPVYARWHEFVDAFLEDFPTLVNTADIHIEMMRNRQGRNETVIDFYYKMLSLGRLGNLDDKSIIRHVTNGLSDERVRQTLNVMQFTTCSEFLRALNGIALTNKTQRSERVNDFQNRQKESHPVVVKTENRRRDGAPPVCYNCREPGHISVNCTKPQRRNRCPSCNKVHAVGEPANCGKKPVASRALVGDHIFTKEVVINGNKWRAFIDTGSQCSMVRRTVVETLGISTEPCTITIKGIGGGTESLTESINLALQVDDVSVTVKLYVVDNHVFQEDLLLGQDVFENSDIKALFENGILKFQVNRSICSDDIIDRVTYGKMSSYELEQLAKLLKTYEDRFATGLQDIGKTDLLKFKIELDTDVPISQAPYRVPYPKRETIKKLVQDLLDAGIIERSTSEYASPITLVKKPDGSDRFCVDYRRLNKHMRKEVYPMPNIEERLHDAKQYKMFCSLDLNSGYYQIVVDEESRKYTAFITPDGLFQFTRTPFGVRHAPMTFLRLMSLLNDQLPPGTMLHYMDDILIGANSPSEMFEKLKLVLEALRQAGLTLNTKKCSFFTDTITFLGHKLTPSGIEPGEIKTRAIANFATPTNVKEVRRFLGLSGYFRKFVPAYAVISEPLRQLLRKNEPFVWTGKQEDAFQILKQKLTRTPVLVAYDVQAKHQIHTDASAIGLAAVLMQDTTSGWKPVAYYSRSTNPNEQKFHSYELETLAVVEGLERFRYYVYGKHITVVTDCSAVEATWEKREMIPRIARWFLRVVDYDIELEYRSESRMCHVDALSRAPDESPKIVEPATLRLDRVDVSVENWLYAMQLQDESIRATVERLQQKDKHTCNEFVLDGGRLMKRVDGRKLYVVPKALRYQVVMDAHVNGAHLSVDRTIEHIVRLMWFPRMRCFVKSCLKACIDCAYNKHVGGKSEGEYHFSDMAPIPFKIVHVDHLGPFPKSSKRMEHLLVVVDAFTKYTFMKAVPSTASKHTIRALEELGAWVGMPETIVSDRGTSYTSNEFKRFCQEHAIRHVLNAVRTPRANGQVERMNRTILSMLLPLTKQGNKWDDGIRQIQWTLNSTKNATTKQSPHDLLFGFQPRDILANKLALVLHDSYSEEIDDDMRLQNIKSQRDLAVKNIAQTREKAKDRFDKGHSTPTIYAIGDLVLVANEAASTGTSRKLEPKYKGPFIVTAAPGNDRYIVEDLPGSQRNQRHYRNVYASDAMKPWCTFPPDTVLPDEVEEISEDADVEGWPTVNPDRYTQQNK